MMLTIALDEQGHFENVDGKRKKEPLFIGGLIYDDRDSSVDHDREKKRIRLYLKAVCEENQVEYPQGLHYEEGGGVLNERLGKVKEQINHTLGGFLRHGTCPIRNRFGTELNSMKPREGRYHLFAMARLGNVQEKEKDHDTSILAREDYASNLYVHMAEEIVERLIFHNPVLEIRGKILLDLATRMAVIEGKDAELRAREYRKLGYREREDLSKRYRDKRFFPLTNADIYRTAVEREMLDTGKREIQLDKVRVHSIYYQEEQEGYGMEFLFLADVVCSVLGYQVDTGTAGAMIEDMAKRARRYTGQEQNLIFAYDEVDIQWKKAWRRLEEKDYFEALKLSREGMRMSSPYAEYYKNNWFSQVSEHLKKETDAAAFGIALQKYHLFSESNNLNQEDLVSIYQVLETMLGNMVFQREEDQSVLYELYDAGISAYSHIGDSLRAGECFERCIKYAGCTELERYLKTRNKMAVYLMDNFSYQEALDIVQDNELYQKELLTIREMVCPDQDTSVHYGITLSQLGQVQAALHMPESEDSFLAALEQIRDTGSYDYIRTLSYLLHGYLEMGEKERYDRRATEYFGGEQEHNARLTYLIREGAQENGVFSMKFALYVYVKGLYCFHLDEISGRLLDRLCRIEKEIGKIGGEKALSQINNHPWEIIYKYLALIAWKKGRKPEAESCMAKAGSILSFREYTLDAICRFAELEYAAEKGELADRQEQMEAFLAHLAVRNEKAVKAVKAAGGLEAQYQYVREHVINFMYR